LQPYKNFRELASSILLQAVNDSKLAEYKTETKTFFKSKWCETLCDCINLDVESLRTMRAIKRKQKGVVMNNDKRRKTICT